MMTQIAQADGYANVFPPIVHSPHDVFENDKRCPDASEPGPPDNLQTNDEAAR